MAAAENARLRHFLGVFHVGGEFLLRFGLGQFGPLRFVAVDQDQVLHVIPPVGWCSRKSGHLLDAARPVSSTSKWSISRIRDCE
jgi:hypothetical protein